MSRHNRERRTANPRPHPSDQSQEAIDRENRETILQAVNQVAQNELCIHCGGPTVSVGLIMSNAEANRMLLAPPDVRYAYPYALCKECRARPDAKQRIIELIVRSEAAIFFRADRN